MIAMHEKYIKYRILILATLVAVVVVAIKYMFHYFNWEPIQQSSSAIFVIGFLLSATIADYKESERIPAEFAANVEDIYSDSKMIHISYSDFDIEGIRKHLLDITQKFYAVVRSNDRGVSSEIRDLAIYFAQMEKAGVPPNFIVKLKQQQALLLKHRKRVTYIQRIKFIPSATLLARSIVVLVIGLLIFTNVDPFYGSLAIIGIVSFVLMFMMILIDVISTPFHAEGKTKDDVSMFLLDDAIELLKSEQ